MGLFSLEAVQAHHGDALLLHYGTVAAPRVALIDGGPAGTYDPFLRPRLAALRAERGRGPLRLDLVAVSHIDDDHIHGLIEMLTELSEDGDGEPLVKIRRLWHNSFEGLVSGEAARAAAGLVDDMQRRSSRGVAPPPPVLKSVPQGRTLRQLAEGMGLALNDPFPDLVVAPGEGRSVQRLPGGLSLTVIGPNQVRVDALREEWMAALRRLGDKSRVPAAVQHLDESVFNLSSIVLLAKAGGKTMLLTGDARSDDILTGLETAGLLRPGRSLHVDMLKLPHHGSDRNVTTEFFRRVTADHYVVSADGRHHNPELATFDMIAEARGTAPYTVHLTNREERLRRALRRRDNRTVVHRADRKRSIVVDLADALPSS